MKMSTIPTVVLGKMVWIILILSSYYLYTLARAIIRAIKIWPYRKSLKKFKKICKKNHIKMLAQEMILIRKYIDEQEKRNNKIVYYPTSSSPENTNNKVPQGTTNMNNREKPNESEEPKWHPNGWYFDEKIGKWTPPDYVEPSEMGHGSLIYNEKVRMWVRKDQCDPIENQRRYEENRRRWAEFEKWEEEREQQRRRLEIISELEQNRPIEDSEGNIKEQYFGQYEKYSDLTDEELKLLLKIRIERKEPTYEEWKAAKEAEKHQDE